VKISAIDTDQQKPTENQRLSFLSVDDSWCLRIEQAQNTHSTVQSEINYLTVRG